MSNLKIEKICPPCSELSGIIKNIQCNEDGCSQIFPTSSHLQMHILKHHKNQSLINKDKNTLLQYHCPKNGCLYSLESEKYFKTKKLLKQHYLKVHAEKKFICSKCQKGFPTEAAQKHHSFCCGIKFYCSCWMSYDSYEALYSHTKRSHHIINPKYKLLRNLATASDSTYRGQFIDTAPPQIIPVNVLALLTLGDLPKKTTSNLLDKGVQTEPGLVNNKKYKKSSLGKGSEKSSKRKSSQTQTQTRILTRTKRPKTSTHTQTGEYILKRLSKNKRKQSMETQTIAEKLNPNPPENCYNVLNYIPDISLNNQMNGNVCNINDILAPKLSLKPDKNSSATQTSPSTLSNMESLSDNELSLSFLENDSPSSSNLPNYLEINSNFGFVNGLENLEDTKSDSVENNYPLLSYPIDTPNRSCTIETQTEIDTSSCLISEEFDLSANSNTETESTNGMELIYSNMYTQTCEEILFSDFDFADIETQTAWPHYENDTTSNLVSTETQTAFSDKLNQPSFF